MAFFGRRVPHSPIILRPRVLGPPPAAIQFIQGTSQAFGSGSSQSLAFPSNVQPTDFIEVTVGTFASATLTVTDSLGQTYQQAGGYVNNSSVVVSKWYFPNSAGGADTITVAASGSVLMSIWIAEYSGVVGLNPLYATSSDTGTSAAPDTGICAISGSGALVTSAYAQATRVVSGSTVGSPFTDRAQLLNGNSEVGLGTADDTDAFAAEGGVFNTSQLVIWSGISASYIPGSPVAPVNPVTFVLRPKGQFSALAAAQFAHRPLFQPIIRHAGKTAPVSHFMVAGRFESQEAAKIAHRPLFQPVIKNRGAPPAVGKIVEGHGTRASRDAANIAHRPLFQPLTKHPPKFAISGQVRAFSPIASANAFRHQRFQVQALNSANGPPPPGGAPVGRKLIVTFASLAAALYFRRVSRNALKRIGASPSKAKLIRPQGQAVFAATRIRFHELHPGIGRILQYGPPVITPAAGKSVLVGGFASIAAAIAAHRPLFKTMIATMSNVLGPPGPPIPGLVLGGVAPLLNRDPVIADARLRRFTEILSSMYNSLVGRGYIRQDSVGVWSLQTGAFQANRPPGINDDETVDVIPGSIWINTATSTAYMNIINTPGAAVWAVIT